MVAGAALALTLVWLLFGDEGPGKLVLRMFFWVAFRERTVQYPSPELGRKKQTKETEHSSIQSPSCESPKCVGERRALR